MRAFLAAATVVVVLVLASMGATSVWGPVVSILPFDPVPVETGPLPTMPVQTELPIDLDGEGMPEPIQIPDWVGELVRAIAIAVVVALLAWLVAKVVRALRAPDMDKAAAAAGTAVEIPDIDEEEVTLSFEEALARLRSGVAVDDAVVECWRRLEQIASDSGVSRGPSETSEEFTTRILAHTSVDSAALERLASLYRQALFSTHVLTDADRDRAIDCIGQLAAQLRPEVTDAP